VAAVLALAVSVLVSRRLNAPIVRLTRAVRAMEAGRRDVRVAPLRGPTELGELAESFDRMADALAKEDALRRALVADVAHELRTPLAVLEASSEALVEGVVPVTPEQLFSLHDEVLRLSRMVGDLETLASAEAAGLRLERRPVALDDVARGAADGLRLQFDSAGVELRVELEPATVTGDADRLRQVATNLLTNAIKFTPAGGAVTLRVHPSDRRAVLEVTDTGVGIPADDLPHLFERFWRGPDQRGRSGSGIGLAVVDELVGAHGGVVEVSSAPGHGTAVRVMLPAAEPAQRALVASRPVSSP